MCSRRVWVRVVDCSDKPISLKVNDEDIVSDIIKEVAAMEKLTCRISKLSLYACDKINNPIPDDKKASDLPLNNSMEVPLLIKEARTSVIPSTTLYAAPSSIAKDWPRYHKEYAIQFGTGLPAILHFDPFRTFFQRNSNDPAAQPAQKRYLKQANTLMQVMGKSYDSETLRQQALKDIFVFRNFNFASHSSKTFSKGTITSDLSVVVEAGLYSSSEKIAIANLELNDLGKGDSNANYESIGYYLHFSSSFLKLIGRADLAPMLLITLIGNSYMQAFGAFRNSKNDTCVDPISPPVSLCADSNKAITVIAHFLESVFDLISDLRQYYSQTLHHNAHSATQAGFPFYSATQDLIYTDHICRGTFRGLYRGTDVVIKFIDEKSYGLVVHQHLAEKALAPKILHYQDLGLGWTVIVMQLIPHVKYEISSLTQSQKLEQANTILDALNEKGYVHGDLRLPNLLLNEKGKIIIVDFDWAGEQGSAQYPVNLNHKDIEWPEGVQSFEDILHEHDKKMLFQSLDIH